MTENYGKTWWGKEWLQALSNIDYSNRLLRGASYARKGLVHNLRIKNGEISAQVQGRRVTPYRETIAIEPFTHAEIEKLIDAILLKPLVVAKLLNRELDPQITDIARSLHISVFPESWDHLTMRCTCPDWAVPCKHLAAVIYIISQEIDNNPFIIFQLHGMDLLAELERRDIGFNQKEAIGIPTLTDTVLAKAAPTSAQARLPIDFTKITASVSDLVAILPDNPPFGKSKDFKEVFAQNMEKMTKLGIRIRDGKVSIGMALDGCGLCSITPHTTAKMRISKNGKTALLLKERDNGTLQEVDAATFAQALSSLPADRIDDYSPSVQAFRTALLFSIHLLAHGALVPQISKTGKSTYLIRWLPAYLDSGIAGIAHQVNELFPSGTVTIKPKPRGKRLERQAEAAVAMFLSRFIDTATSPSIARDICTEAFFGCVPVDFGTIGDREIPGGIKSWLDRLHITARRYIPVFVVDEDVENSAFKMSIHIEDTQQREAGMIPLRLIMNSPEHMAARLDVLRELSLISGIAECIPQYIIDGANNDIIFGYTDFMPFLLKTIPILRLLGLRVMLPKGLNQLLRPRVSINLKERKVSNRHRLRLDDILDFDWRVALGDNLLPPDEFERLLGHAKGLVRFKQSYIYVDADDILKIKKALAAPKPLTPTQLMHTALTEEYQGATITLTDEVRQLMRQLTQKANIPVPKGITATLRPYQERGYSWMYRNLSLGFGSIIADDMGLGKTLQVITLLQKLKDEGALDKHRAIVVAPTGLLINWQAEIDKFAPSLTHAIYHGSNRDINAIDTDITITSYGTLRSDIDILKKRQWSVVVIDEAQNIKNADTAQSKAARSLPAKTHIAMSGTPVENRLTEFWTIMDFANKGYLGTPRKFNEEYVGPIQLSGDTLVAERFRKLTAPLMIRRLKTDRSIIADLPDKIEQDEYAILTPRQAALYEQIVNEALETIESEKESTFKRSGLILQMILVLKQVCNHPVNYLKNGDIDPSASGKVQMLLDLVDAINSAGEKALIFTQFTEMAELLVKFIESRIAAKPLYIHGGLSVKQRHEVVNRFQNSHTDRFLVLSLKAAGTGLNLTAASHVIHFDLWWNPAVEAQATDRAYRIGQDKNVVVHRFITKNTFEERINAMIQQKKALASLTVASGESWIGDLSDSELRSIFSL